MSKRRKFSDEFKREAAGLTRQPARSSVRWPATLAWVGGGLGRGRRELETGKATAFTGSGVPCGQEMATLNPGQEGERFFARCGSVLR